MINTVILVDKNDNEIGIEEKYNAHKFGLLHRAFSIFILRKNPDLELLLQQRALTKYHSGGLWTNSCCGHPRAFELLTDAACRRLNEEMGLTIPLQEIGNFTYKANLNDNLIEHEFDHVFIGYWNNHLIVPNPEEVQMIKWCKIDDLLVSMNKTPYLFTTWFKESLQMVINFVNLKEDIVNGDKTTRNN